MINLKKPNLVKRFTDIAFLLIVAGFLALGAIKALVSPKEVNLYENRTANQLPEISVSGSLSGDFQNGVEAALSDQVLLAQTMESSYYYLHTSFQLNLSSSFIARHPDEYISVLGVKTFGGSHLVYDVQELISIQSALDAKAENINKAIAAHPELDFYIYYIEKDTDINFATGEKTGGSEYLRQAISLPGDKFGVFSIDDFQSFDEKFYRTDHHWNCYGSYQAYVQVMQMLDASAELLRPLEETVLKYPFSGSKASTIGAKDVFVENFPAYRFDYPEMDITSNGVKMADYGNQHDFLTGAATGKISYASFYGGDIGEIVFDTHQTEKENLLVIGESYDNAILKLLASHYNCTYSIDLRHYERLCGETFHLADYAQAHNISKVLLIGNVDYFTASEFSLED